uniref:Mitochondrial fission process protein 1 n=1 Tax=Strigamia maritima TaxID=126957 RepID=T1IUK7_STRMM
MSEPRRKGRLFRDEPKEPPREQPKETEKSNSPLVRQTDHTLPPHDGSFKSELKPESKPQQRPVPSPQEKERPPPPSSPPAQLPMQTQKPRPPQEAKSQELDARSLWVKKTSEASRRADVDLYRETPVRFLGYSEEVGEALRPFIPKLIVRGSYLMTSVYILADTMDKTVKTSEVY